MYKFCIKHILGKLNAAPDGIFRYLALPKHIWAMTNNTTQHIDSAIKASVVSVYTHDPKMKAITWDRVVVATATDEEC